jgi:dTDP-glucose 4,6-dehydratase
MSPKSLKNYKERILVTGGAGFIGSNFLNYFVPLRPRTLFVNVDCLTYAGDLKNIKVSSSANYIFEKADIRSRKKLESIFKKYRLTGVIHFAAESHVDLSIKNPRIFLETNILGTENLLALSVIYKVERFLLVSTDEVYGALGPGDAGFKESDVLDPRSPYSASKAGAEHLTRAYANTYKLDVVITRSSNNYGPNQDKSKLIPLFVTNLLKDKPVPLYGKGLQVRDWLYVEDNVRAIDLIFRKGRSGEVYNVGGDCELSNVELTKKLLSLLKKGEKMIKYVADRPGHDFRYSLDSAKIKKLGWSPSVLFEEGLRRTLEYFRSGAEK